MAEPVKTDSDRIADLERQVVALQSALEYLTTAPGVLLRGSRTGSHIRRIINDSIAASSPGDDSAGRGEPV